MSAAAVVIALVNSAWQGIVLVTVVALALRLAPRINAATSCAIWSAAFVAVALLPFADLAFSRSGALGAAAPFVQPTVQVAAGVLARSGDRFGPILLGAWLALAIVFLFMLARNGIALLRLKRDARPLDGPASRAVAARAGRRRDAGVCVSERVGVPCAAGFSRPMVLVPSTLATTLDESDLTRVVLHEAAHIDRYDDWSNAVERVLRAIFFFQPGLLFAGSRIDLERELACDDRVLAATGEPVRYAECLAAIVEHQVRRRRPGIVPGFFVGRSQVAARIVRLVDRKRNASVALARPFALALPALVATAVCIATIQISFAPVPSAVVPAVHDSAPLAMVPRRAIKPSHKHLHPRTAASTTVANVRIPPPTARPAPRRVVVPMVVAAARPIPRYAQRGPVIAHRGASAKAPPARNGPRSTAAPHVESHEASGDVVAQSQDSGDADASSSPADDDTPGDTALAGALSQAGFQPSADDLATLVDHGVTPEFVQAAVDEGVKIPSMHVLRSISGRGLNHAFVVAAVHHVAPVAFDDVVALRDAEVSAAYLDNLAAAGYDRLSSRDAIALNENEITPEYVCDIASAGYPHLAPHDLIVFHDEGVDGNFLRELARKGYRGLSTSEIVRLREAS